MFSFLCACLVLCAVRCKARMSTRVVFVVPFVDWRIEKLHSFLDTWRIYPPFGEATRFKSYLVFYSNGAPLSEETGRALVDKACKIPHSFLCSHVWFANADLSEAEEGYPMGPNAMFKRMFAEPLYSQLQSFASHFFLMESDCRPLRASWAESIGRLASNQRAAMVGSLFYGNEHLPSTYAAHINGNAMYSLRNAELPGLVHRYVDIASDAGYDEQIYRKMATTHNIAQTLQWLHLFAYTRVVMNYAWSSYNSTHLRLTVPEVVLVHGMHDVAMD